jgi:hypothetical protein
MSTVVKPTPDHLRRLPYEFQDLEIFHIKSTDEWSYYAKWEGKSVSSQNLSGPWFFEDEEREITVEDWNALYPGYEHITPEGHLGGKAYSSKLNAYRLGGTFLGKRVIWSITGKKWVYVNGLTVSLPVAQTHSRAASPAPREPSPALRELSPEAEDSQDKQLVTSILERTQSSLVSLAEQIRTGTPEPNPA